MDMPTAPAARGPHDGDSFLAAAGRLLDLALQAYVWGYPLVVMRRTRHLLTSAGHPFGAPVNSFMHVDRLMTPASRAVPKPNNDTVYSSAWLDLRGGPLVLGVPDMADRYYSLQFMDAYTNTWAYVGRRTTGTNAGRFVVTGPGWAGDPPGLPVLASPTDTVWLVGRTLVHGPGDLPAVRDLIRRYTLTPLEPAGEVAARHAEVPQSPHGLGSAGIGFFDELCAAIADDPPPAGDRPVLERFAELGIGPARIPSAEVTDPFVRHLLDSAGAAGDVLLSLPPSPHDGVTPETGGWSYNLGTGSYGQRYLLRAQVALQGLAAVHPQEALYVSARHDDQGRPLHGERRYVLRFPAGELPPADAFWSLTAYGEDHFLIPNPLARYSLGDRTPGLVYESDGSLQVFIGRDEPPHGAANWLPAGPGPFELTLRCYQPRPELLDGRYTVPPLVSLEDRDAA
jgi:hypothetical protein